ncbi:hypothetical protein BKA82DRAFT_4360567 [Pisolithus tinctorius]|nr:hypothetical protein BKA82DRAFT_4360567 [Pisolithus tinctorius]
MSTTPLVCDSGCMSQCPSQAPPESPALDVETSSSASKGRLSKIKHFFHWETQSHQTTAMEGAQTNTDGGPLEQIEQSPAPGSENICYMQPPAHAMSLADPPWMDSKAC